MYIYIYKILKTVKLWHQRYCLILGKSWLLPLCCVGEIMCNVLGVVLGFGYCNMSRCLVCTVS